MTLDWLLHSLGTSVLIPQTGLILLPMTVPTVAGPQYLLPSFSCVYIETSKSFVGTTRTSHFFILKAIWMEFRRFAFPIWNQEPGRGKLINMHCHNILSHSNIWYMIKCINSEHHKYLWLHLSMKANEFPLAWVSLEINFNVTKCLSQEMFDVAQLAYASLICSRFTPWSY